MNVVMNWNCEPSDRINRELIEKDIKSEIEQSFRMLEIDEEEAIASVNLDPFSSTLIGAVLAQSEIVLTFTYSLASGHSATYTKVT